MKDRASSDCLQLSSTSIWETLAPFHASLQLRKTENRKENNLSCQNVMLHYCAESSTARNYLKLNSAVPGLLRPQALRHLKMFSRGVWGDDDGGGGGRGDPVLLSCRAL